jgi:glycosyltransferase involved in cell wall biosynthesis
VKRLAYVAYFFPPTGGAGVQRTVKFVRYLPEHGWSPTVITVRASHYWMEDPTLLAEIPPSVEIVRTRALTGPALLGRLGGGRRVGKTNAQRSGGSQRLLRRIAGWVSVPDAYAGWAPFATRAAARVLRGGGVLLTTSSPDSAHLVGLDPALRHVPWVADFRDPWVRRMSYRPPTPVHRRLHESLEARVVRAATRILLTSEATRRDFLERYPGVPPERFVVIENGYDEEDFPREEPRPDPSFRILHLGQLNPERRITPFLDCLEAFLRSRPEARERVRADFIGPRYREDEAEVAARGLGEIVRFEDALPHADAILRLFRARVLLLLEQDSERGALILPGKTLEMLRAHRPILALVPRGAASELVESLHAGLCARPGDPAAGASQLEKLYEASRGAAPAGLVADPDLVRRFERRALTARLAALLDELPNLPR